MRNLSTTYGLRSCMRALFEMFGFSANATFTKGTNHLDLMGDFTWVFLPVLGVLSASSSSSSESSAFPSLPPTSASKMPASKVSSLLGMAAESSGSTIIRSDAESTSSCPPDESPTLLGIYFVLPILVSHSVTTHILLVLR